MKIKQWWDEFAKTGKVQFDKFVQELYQKDFLSYSVTDQQTLHTIKKVYESECYLLDPHSAVAVVASEKLKDHLGKGKIICLATAHPAKFADIIKHTLGVNKLPDQAKHQSIETAKKRCQKVYLCDHTHLEESLQYAMETNWDLTKGKSN